MISDQSATLQTSKVTGDARRGHTSGVDWIGLCSVLRPRQHSIGYMGDGFYRSKDPTNSINVLEKNLQSAYMYVGVVHATHLGGPLPFMAAAATEQLH